jgi:hypothetical protein
MNLTTYLQAGYPGLAVITSEEARAEAEIATACKTAGRNLLAWSSTEGLGGSRGITDHAMPGPA